MSKGQTVKAPLMRIKETERLSENYFADWLCVPTGRAAEDGRLEVALIQGHAWVDPKRLEEVGDAQP